MLRNKGLKYERHGAEQVIVAEELHSNLYLERSSYSNSNDGVKMKQENASKVWWDSQGTVSNF